MLYLKFMMMMIAPYSPACKGGKERGEVKGKYGGIWGEEDKADYWGMVQPSQQYVAPRVNGVEWFKTFKNGGSVLGRYPGRGYTESQYS